MSPSRAVSRRTSFLSHPLTFLLTAASLYAFEIAVVRTFPGLDDASTVAWGVTADLVLLIPLLYYLMLVRGRGWPWFSVVPVFLVSLLGAGAVLPETHHGALQALEMVAIPAELLLLGFLFTRAARLVKSVRGSARADLFDRLRESARETLGVRVPAEVLAYEASTFYYALFSWRTKAPQDSAESRAWTHYRSVSYGIICAGLIMAVLVEIVPVHLLLELWSPIAAWVATGLSLYSLIWLLGDYRAVVLRPTRIEDDVLYLRVGLRWNAEIPLAAIRSFQKLDPRDPEPSGDYVNVALFGRPQQVLELERPIEVRGVYGLARSVDTVGLTIDDEASFASALSLRDTDE